MKKIQLSKTEKGVLFIEGIGTFILFQIINVVLVLISTRIFQNGNVNISKMNLTHDSSVWFFFILVIIVEMLFSLILTQKTYHQYEVKELAKQLSGLASSPIKKPIDLQVNKRLQNVVNSINLLVSNTNQHIKEQRESEKSKDELITNVSHDIRTPLTSIIGYLGLIESDNYQSIEQFLKYTHIAYKKSLEMQNLVNSLFEYANVQHATSKLNMSRFDMAQMLEQLSADFELEAKKRGMKIIVDADPKSIMMNGDTEKLGRTFNNLITNAFKYGNGATELYLKAQENAKGVVVTIANNGAMIPKESLPNLFDRFYRVENSRSKKTGGTGLGLAIAQSMVKMHGGTIVAESTPEITSFIIHFPIELSEE